MTKTIYEKFRAGVAISDSELNTCDESAIDVIRFLENELKIATEQYNQVVLQNKSLQGELKDTKEIKEKIQNKYEYVFSEIPEQYDSFCDICCAKNICNGNCCYEQIKELLKM